MHFERHSRSYTTLALAILLILASILLVWQARVRLDDFHVHQHELAKQSVEGTAYQISSFINEKKRRVANFTKYHAQLISHLAEDPDNEQLRKKLERIVAENFPDYFAVTIANEAGEVLLGNFELLVNEACQLDIQNYANDKHSYEVYIHPHVDSYHFDIMAPWSDGETKQGVFFVSFKPQLLAKLIANTQIHRHQLMVLRNDTPGLIEITAEGTRVDLAEQSKNFFLSAAQQNEIVYLGHVSGTLWDLVDIPDSELAQEQAKTVWGQTIILFLLLAMISTMLLAFLKRAEKHRLISEQALYDATKQLQNALDFSDVSTWELNLSSGEFSWSDNAYSIFSSQPPQTLSEYLGTSHPSDREIIQTVVNNCKTQATACHIEHRLLSDDNSVKWVEITGNLEPYKHTSTDKMIGLITDITARKHTEVARLAAEKKLRETLIREVHHRIKNNLQGVSGLLMQHGTRHPESKDIINLAVSQLHSVSTVYGLECDEGNGEINLADLAADISLSIANMTGYPIRFTCLEEQPSAILEKDKSVAIALILNELIFNAVKHSSKKNRMPVKVNLKSSTDEDTVEVINQSSSFPAGFDLANKKGLGTGLSLVKSLLPKHGARLDIQYKEDAVIATLFLSTGEHNKMNNNE
jgi:two-component sensor histidine kinase/PAS domain-containing protein